VLVLSGCREVRVKTYAQGTVTVPGGNQIVVVRDTAGLEALGIHAAVRFRGEFGVALLMGPHKRTGYRQVIESIRASDERLRVVAFEEEPADGGEPSRDYRTYTLWIVPNSVYIRGLHVDVVTPSNDPVASTELPSRSWARRTASTSTWSRATRAPGRPSRAFRSAPSSNATDITGARRAWPRLSKMCARRFASRTRASSSRCAR